MSLHRLALATSLLTFVLIVVGGFVHPTGSSLACPDWPLCYGEVFPEMKGGVLVEHSHRLVAGLVAGITTVLAILTWRGRTDRRARALALLLVATVALQAALGGITVLLRLPMLVSTAHLAVSMTFFLLTIETCFVLAPAAGGATGSPRRGIVLAALALTFAQVVLGGFVRHSGAGMACGDDYPSCGGVLWPELPASQVHQGHRLLGLVVAALVVAASVAALREARRAGRRLAVVAACSAPILVIAQVLLGIWTVLSHVAVPPVVAHLGVAALLVGDLFVLHRSLAPAAAGAFVPVGAAAAVPSA